MSLPPFAPSSRARTRGPRAGPLVGAMLESGAASLDEIGIMGTAADLAAAKEAGDGLGCAYWEVWDSFSNFKKLKPICRRVPLSRNDL